jgi:hypothetical protein
MSKMAEKRAWRVEKYAKTWWFKRKDVYLQ